MTYYSKLPYISDDIKDKLYSINLSKNGREPMFSIYDLLMFFSAKDGMLVPPLYREHVRSLQSSGFLTFGMSDCCPWKGDIWFDFPTIVATTRTTKWCIDNVDAFTVNVGSYHMLFIREAIRQIRHATIEFSKDVQRINAAKWVRDRWKNYHEIRTIDDYCDNAKPDLNAYTKQYRNNKGRTAWKIIKEIFSFSMWSQVERETDAQWINTDIECVREPVSPEYQSQYDFIMSSVGVEQEEKTQEEVQQEVKEEAIRWEELIIEKRKFFI